MRETPLESLWTPHPGGEEHDTTRTWSWRRLRYITVRHWPPPNDGTWVLQTMPWSGAHATIDRRVVLRSSITGSVTLVEGAALQVDGCVFGDICVHENANLIINGYVRGVVENRSGHVLIRGVHDGTVRGDGYAVVEPGAQVPRRSVAE